MTPSQTIRAAREHLGLTQAEFAQLTGHVQATISKWESAQWSPDPWDVELANAMRLAKVARARQLLARKGPIYCLGRILGSIRSL
jgi:DNA-binding transcriptional regulator YiaG